MKQQQTTTDNNRQQQTTTDNSRHQPTTTDNNRRQQNNKEQDKNRQQQTKCLFLGMSTFAVYVCFTNMACKSSHMKDFGRPGTVSFDFVSLSPDEVP